MNPSDIGAIALFGGFGLWWVLLPDSVVRFYRWFHRGQVKMPTPLIIRFIGIAWLILFGAVMLFGRPHHP